MGWDENQIAAMKAVKRSSGWAILVSAVAGMDIRARDEAMMPGVTNEEREAAVHRIAGHKEVLDFFDTELRKAMEA